jgi:hypothetical protein
MAMLNFIYVLTGTDMQAEWWTCGKELKRNSPLMPIMEMYSHKRPKIDSPTDITYKDIIALTEKSSCFT